MRALDIAGQRFGRLVAIAPLPAHEQDRTQGVRWSFRCDCGAIMSTLAKKANHGWVQSCGCLQIDRARAAATIHGQSNAGGNQPLGRVYNIWHKMRSRCSDPNNPRFHRYGGRGVSVCPEWRDSFLSFQGWALAHGYSDDLSIDREDNNGHYEPSNCRWATRDQQAKNRGYDSPVREAFA